ncbi:hypothetical protein M409DRAFT_71425 [Zasmidium cellare ATCC 36951]|uniref:ADP-ribose 1''-phosphate phosphatase n=1 Tax=Zasmidium cellare ATCC 36951 TaxID=1080233 RepID=A0A6A6BXT9_ZASCE|nr:uncharacterized protein M409DRAFT_71425 [Zasmidium cellare ATCC 36951]KAF2158878.1 hypothetical protein M409DRAFT_71425 [Zasmidium cellare ATCC 36951]
MSQPAANSSSAAQPVDRILPDIHLLCMDSKFSDAFEDAAAKHFPEIHSHSKITVFNCSLKYLPENVRVDGVVSPANSYARLDGAFDDALARAYGPRDDYGWITRKAQKVVYEKWRGFAPPGTCTVVRLDHDGKTASKDSNGHVHHLNPWATEYLLLCPTMRVPDDVRWDREVVYECVWSLLCAIDEHNRAVRNTSSSGDEREIKIILMTPFATGIGRVSPKKWAEQCVLAMKQYVEAVRNPQIWSSLEWSKIVEDHEEVQATYASQA